LKFLVHTIPGGAGIEEDMARLHRFPGANQISMGLARNKARQAEHRGRCELSSSNFTNNVSVTDIHVGATQIM
jgi:hypothetical protein